MSEPKPKHLPWGQADMPLTAQDCADGSKLAEIIGDLFIDPSMTPVAQWSIVMRALRVHGLTIVNEERGT